MYVDYSGNFSLLIAIVVIVAATLITVVETNIDAVIESNINMSNSTVEPMDETKFDNLIDAKNTTGLTLEEEIAFVKRQRIVWAEKDETRHLLDEWTEAEMLREISYHNNVYSFLSFLGLEECDWAESAKLVEFESNQNFKTYARRAIGNLLSL